MGSIRGIWRDPAHWVVAHKGKLKDDGRDLLEVTIGWYDDYLPGDYICYMLKDHYDGIVSRKISFRAYPYSNICLELYDSSGKKIEPLMRGGNRVF